MKEEVMELIDKIKYINGVKVCVYNNRVVVKYNEVSKQSSINIKVDDIKSVELELEDYYYSLHIMTEYGAITIRDGGIEIIIY